MTILPWLVAFKLGLYEPVSTVANPYLSHAVFPYTEVGFSEEYHKYNVVELGVPGKGGYYRPEYFEGLSLPINKAWDVNLGWREGSNQGPYLSIAVKLDKVCWRCPNPKQSDVNR